MRALRFEVGRLLKDAWDACFGTHVFFLVDTWLVAGLPCVASRLAFKREGTRDGGRLRVKGDRTSGFEDYDSIWKHTRGVQQQQQLQQREPGW
jgi:hypothetical protein